jgi:hypothetical protein
MSRKFLAYIAKKHPVHFIRLIFSIDYPYLETLSNLPRPLRVEYEGAYYYVMNRGRRLIFHDKRYYHAFLDTLTEAHQRFKVIIHAYCLMGNHYHLLLETPEANLNRIIRHINGVYTQR